jgi:hypothetical protein
LQCRASLPDKSIAHSNQWEPVPRFFGFSLASWPMTRTMTFAVLRSMWLKGGALCKCRRVGLSA